MTDTIQLFESGKAEAATEFARACLREITSKFGLTYEEMTHELTAAEEAAANYWRAYWKIEVHRREMLKAFFAPAYERLYAEFMQNFYVEFLLGYPLDRKLLGPAT